MDISFKPEDVAFREEVRSFIADAYPQALKSKHPFDYVKEDFLSWARVLHKKGWIAPHWPVEFGGTDWTLTQRYIWDEETARADCISLPAFGLKMLGPVLIEFGSDAQKKHFLPRILSGEDWWCQGYSEPDAGSDLAQLSTRAERKGDKYVVNGSKIWTTQAHMADWIFALVRTDPDVKPQAGISFLLIDMKTPGLRVAPIISMSGHHTVNQIFFEDVEVPVENRVGEENRGWTYAKFLLTLERIGIAGVARSKRALAVVREIATLEQQDGKPLIEDADFRRQVSELEIDLMTLEYMDLRVLAAESQGEMPGAEASFLKVLGSELQQRISELAVQAVGPYAAPVAPMGVAPGTIGDNALKVGPDYALAIAQNYFDTRATTIYSGSNEIQRNIVAKTLLSK